MSTSPRGADELVSGQAIPETTVNEVIRHTEAGACHFPIVDKDLAAPPGTCDDGANYIIAATATGAWASKETQIATALGANAANGWRYHVPVEGFTAYVQDDNARYLFNGSAWTADTSGGLGAATASDVNTGTSTTSAITPDALAGSNLGKAVVTLLVSDPAGDAITTGDGKCYYRVPPAVNGMNLVAAAAVLDTAGTGGGFLCQLRRKRSGADVDMLSTRISIDSGENDSIDAATPPAINGANDDVATADRIYIDLDGVPTGGKGLVVQMEFQLP